MYKGVSSPEPWGDLLNTSGKPVRVKYDNGWIRLSPKARTKSPFIKSKLGSLPSGVRYISRQQ